MGLNKSSSTYVQTIKTVKPIVVLSTEQVKEHAALDLSTSKHSQSPAEHATQEATPPKAPQTKADEQINALFAIGVQSVEKDGTYFFNPNYKPFTPLTEEVMDVEQDPAIVTLVGSYSSGRGLAATLARLGPDRPLASWPKRKFAPVVVDPRAGCWDGRFGG
ncbi:hypothetical protein FKW77_004673 [Venturia effusa]|uniref:Uncharacterized protein n=1 Tax=Venturia effusa TaxID=50376 RepID=A0A517L969_9PEZI|nr:hypothetical protein FKW77_004673 [Venturia effusa]